MNDFNDLLAISDRLHGPDGCPWDKKQTLFSLQPAILEEAHELVDAIDTQEMEKVVEEAGDLLFQVIFVSKILEKESDYSIEDIIASVCEKLIRRHPHIFGDRKADTAKEVAEIWQEVKKAEKLSHPSPLEEVSKRYSALLRAQKLLKRILLRKKDFSHFEKEKRVFENFQSQKEREWSKRVHEDTEQESLHDSSEKSKKTFIEELIGENLWQWVLVAEEEGINAESALRRILYKKEKKYQHWEEENKKSEIHLEQKK